MGASWPVMVIAIAKASRQDGHDDDDDDGELPSKSRLVPGEKAGKGKALVLKVGGEIMKHNQRINLHHASSIKHPAVFYSNFRRKK